MSDSVLSYMSAPVLSIDSEATALEAAQMMKNHDIGSIIVKGITDFVGVVTERDLTRKILGENRSHSTPVSAIMNSPIFYIEQDEPIMNAYQMMRDLNVRHLSVAEDGHIIGVISMKNILAYQLKKGQSKK